MLKKRIERQAAYKVLRPYVTEKGSKQTSLTRWLPEAVPSSEKVLKVLDLGCGEGKSIDLFRSVLPNSTWRGIDIEESPEVSRRTRQDGAFDTFDGVELPYPDNEFDIVFSNQALEHVRYPDALLPQTCRVLRPGGIFLGAVSYLEPYHSHSIFNFTPYGLARSLMESGFKDLEIRPGIDAYSLITRQLFGGARFLDFLFWSSPGNWLINLFGAAMLLPRPMIAVLKVQFCGQLCFKATK